MVATHDRERESEGGEASGGRVGRALFSSGSHAHDALCRRCRPLSRSCRAPPHPRAERNPSPFPCLKAKVKKLGRRITVGEDKAYDTADHVSNLRAINVTPHVAQNDSITLTGKR